MDQILQFLGQVVAYGGGGAVVAFLLFQYFGKQWLDSKFAQRLEAFRHQQAKELQHLRVEVESLLSGALKIQEREFTVLPEAWNKLSEAHGLIDWVASPLQSQVDIFKLQPDQLEEYFEGNEFSGSEQRRLRELRDSQGHNRTFEAFRIVSAKRRQKAAVAVTDLQRYLLTHGLFLPRQLKEQFLSAARAMRDALFHLQLIDQPGDVGNHSKAQAYAEEATKLRNAIELEIEARLHSHGRPFVANTAGG